MFDIRPIRLLRMLAHACLILVLSGCQEPVTTTLSLWLDTHEKEMELAKKAADLFEKENPGIKLALKFVPFKDLKPALLGQAETAREPDLFFLVNDWLGELVAKKVLAPIKEDSLRFLPITLQSLQVGDTLYALPRSFQVVALAYNKRLVPTPPFTVPEMIATARRLQQRGLFGLMYDNRNFYYHAPWFYGYGAQLFDSRGEVQLQTPQALRSFQFAVDLEQKYQAIPSKSNDSAALNLFNAGQVGMVITGPWAIAEMKKNKISYGIAPLPFLENGRSPRPFIGVRAIGISRYSRYPEAARKAAYFFTSERVQKLIVEELYELPSLVNLYNTENIPLEQQGFFRQSTNSIPMPTDAAMSLVWREMNWVLSQLFANGKPAPELLREAEAKIRQAVRAGRKL